jgi:hypothetical protein
MTDLTPNDLSHLSDAEFNSLCPQGEHAPGREPLSPAGSLVERVEAATRLGGLLSLEDEARAAIREVAAWLREHGDPAASAWAMRLEQEAER